MKAKYLQIKDEIADLDKRKKELTDEMHKRCPHKNIKREDDCVDDYGSYDRLHSTIYTCSDCNEWAYHSYDSKQPKSAAFLKLEELSRKQSIATFKKRIS
jgi:hypothetical protein